MNQTVTDYLTNNSSISQFPTNVSNTSSKLLNNSSIILNNSIENITQNVTNLTLQADPIKIDPNWFYSSSAQCAAAIVGLMGAFLTTKLINQKSFVDQVLNEISDYKRRIELINQEITPKIEFVKNIDFENDCNRVREFLDSIKLLIDPINPPSLDKLYNGAKTLEELKGVSQEAFEHEYNDGYLGKVRKAAEKLVDEYLNDSLRSIDLEKPPELKSLYDAAIKEEDYKLINISIFEERYKLFLKTKKEERKRQKSFLSGFSLQTSVVKMPDVVMQSRDDIENNRINLEKYSRYKEEILNKKAEISSYQEILRKKEHLLKFNDDILSLKNNFLLLFIFSLLGVFLPLFMLLLDYETMIKYRGYTFFLITLGWLLIVFNLKVEIWRLMDKRS